MLTSSLAEAQYEHVYRTIIGGGDARCKYLVDFGKAIGNPLIVFQSSLF